MNQIDIEFMNVHTDSVITVGPFEFVQLTYRDLRVGPEGDFLAYINEDGDWVIHPEPTVLASNPSLLGHIGNVFSDVVIAPRPPV